jgi:hypothetical protein
MRFAGPAPRAGLALFYFPPWRLPEAGIFIIAIGHFP